MRITESQLRRAIRSVLREAPLADLYEPMLVGSLSKVSSEPEELARLKAKYEHPQFRAKLTKLLDKFPVNVSVLPGMGHIFQVQERYLILTRAEFLSPRVQHELSAEANVDPDKSANRAVAKPALDLIKAWALNAPADEALVVPVAHSEGNKRQNVTAWNVFHSLFDTFAESAALTPNVYDLSPSARGVRDAIDRAVVILQLEGRAWYGSREGLEAAEAVFTMGSARMHHFSRVSRGLDDLPNEAATQACLDSRGFRYNDAAVDALAISEQSKAALREKLDAAVALSPSAREEFAAALRGKIIITNALP